MVARIMRHLPDVENVFFDERKKKNPEERIKAFIVVTADKGMAGAYNHNILKLAMEKINECEHYKIFVVG
jgi:F-type H+-transporting ATPase subunit gamma